MKVLIFLFIINCIAFVSSSESCYELLVKGTTEKNINEELEANIGKYLNELGYINS